MTPDPKLPKESAKPIESVDKALEILECFSELESELTLKQLSERTGLYKSRILRLCGTLLARGYIVRSQGSVYSLGPAVIRLGKTYERTNSLVSLARPVLKALATETGESAKLFVVQGNRRVCLARVKGPLPLSYDVVEGESFALHAGSAGLVLLAYAPEKVRDRVLGNGGLERFTPNTMVERHRLEAVFTRIRNQGYAVSRGELLDEVAGMSAPVFNFSNLICASITIAGPAHRFTESHCRKMLPTLLASAKKLSSMMGCAETSADG